MTLFDLVATCIKKYNSQIYTIVDKIMFQCTKRYRIYADYLLNLTIVNKNSCYFGKSP